MGFAIFGAICICTSLSLINDYFKHEHKARANSFYSFGIYMGVACSSLTLILDNKIGWRNSVLGVSVVCITFGILLVFIKEPRS